MANVLVTGASGGFGRLIVRSLIPNKHTVVATMRDPEQRNQSVAQTLAEEGAIVVAMDVSDEKSVQNAVQQAQQRVGEIDVVVNNAGVGVLGLQETFTAEDFHRLFDVNVFGVQRVNRTVLPRMRVRNSGLLIHISSLLGRFVLPFFGPYNASKFALEGLAESYRVELAGQGIESVIVEPGGYGTDFHHGLLTPTDADRAAEYGEISKAPAAMMENFQKSFASDSAPNPQDVADAVVNLIEMPRGERPFRTVVDGLGMGDGIATINQTSEQVTKGIYGHIGMAEMLNLKP